MSMGRGYLEGKFYNGNPDWVIESLVVRVTILSPSGEEVETREILAAPFWPSMGPHGPLSTENYRASTDLLLKEGQGWRYAILGGMGRRVERVIP